MTYNRTYGSTYITVRTELSFWPSMQMSEPIWYMDTVNCQDGMIMWRKVGWERGKDCHIPVVFLHIVMNCVHSSESEITNCQSLWQFLFSIFSCQIMSFLNEFMCGPLHWEGTLCWKCKDGYGTALYSYTLECSECWGGGYGWILYFFLELVPITVLYFWW